MINPGIQIGAFPQQTIPSIQLQSLNLRPLNPPKKHHMASSWRIFFVVYLGVHLGF